MKAPDRDVGVEDILAFPTDNGTGLGSCWLVEPRYAISYDRIPKGEVNSAGRAR